MTDNTAVESALRGVLDPELGTDIVELGMVKGIKVESGIATIKVALTIAACPMRDQIEDDVTRKVKAIPGIDDVVVEVGAMTQAERTTLMERARRHAREHAAPTRVSPLTRVIAVSSGKGGVGKSSMSVNLAVAIADQGHEVGLLDADIWGFSVPRMLGVGRERLEADDDRKIIPMQAQGLHLVSTGLIVKDEETALMWRGLMLSKALEQFLRDVAWPQTLDYLLMDMPPGTGDIQMALARLLPQAEMLVVTTPQKAAQKVAARAADMARRSFMPIIGVIENMSAFVDQHGDTHHVFGSGGGAELAADLGVPLLASIPLDPAIAEGGDSGNPIVRAHPESGAAREIVKAASHLTRLLPPAEDDTCTSADSDPGGTNSRARLTEHRGSSIQDPFVREAPTHKHSSFTSGYGFTAFPASG